MSNQTTVGGIDLLGDLRDDQPETNAKDGRNTNNRQTTTNNRQTTTNSRRNTTNNRQTVTNNRQTTTNNRQTVTNNRQTTTSRRATTNKQKISNKQSTNNRQNVTNIRSAPNNKKSLTSNRQTTINNSRSITNDKRDTFNDKNRTTSDRRVDTSKRGNTSNNRKGKTTSKRRISSSSAKKDKQEERIDISKVQYYSFRSYIHNMLSTPAPYVQGDKNDVVITLQNRAIEHNNVSYVHNIIDALTILKSNYALPNYTIALLYGYNNNTNNNNNHININQIDTDEDYKRLRDLANDSDVWIFLTNVSSCSTSQQCKIHTEIRVRRDSWDILDKDTKRCIMLVDKFLNSYLKEVTSSMKMIKPNTCNVAESISDSPKKSSKQTIIYIPEGTDSDRQQQIMEYMRQNEDDEGSVDEYMEQTSSDREIIVYCNNNNGPKIFEIDPTEVDPRTYKDVERIASPLLFLDALLGPVLAILDLGFITLELLEKFWPLIERTLSEGEGGVGDFFRKIFRKALFKVKSEWVRAYKDLPKEEAKKLILNDILEESRNLQGDPKKARKRLRSLNVDQLKFFGKEVLLDLLSFNNILSDNQRALLYISGVVSEDEVKQYLKQSQSDPKFVELEDHVAKKFEDADDGQLVNSKINYSHLYKHGIYVDSFGLKISDISSEFYTQPIGEAISIGTAIVIAAVLGVIGTSAVGVLGAGATVSVPIVKEFLRTMRKGEGGLGDKLRTRYRGAKRFLRKSFFKRIKGKTEEEILEIFNNELTKKMSTSNPDEIVEELRTLPIGQIGSLSEEILTPLLKNEFLSMKQVALLQIDGKVTEDMLVGTVYSSKYREDVRKYDINQLITLSGARIALLLRGKGFTDDQVVDMLVNEKILIGELRGTPYDFSRIKKKYKKEKKKEKNK